jgi:hypothetical protein
MRELQTWTRKIPGDIESKYEKQQLLKRENTFGLL